MNMHHDIPIVDAVARPPDESEIVYGGVKVDETRKGTKHGRTN